MPAEVDYGRAATGVVQNRNSEAAETDVRDVDGDSNLLPDAARSHG